MAGWWAVRRFDAFLKNLAGMGTVDGDRASATQLPGRSLYDYCFDIGGEGWRGTGGRKDGAALHCTQRC
jgi:hypothetical protein